MGHLCLDKTVRVMPLTLLMSLEDFESIHSVPSPLQLKFATPFSAAGGSIRRPKRKGCTPYRYSSGIYLIPGSKIGGPDPKISIF